MRLVLWFWCCPACWRREFSRTIVLRRTWLPASTRSESETVTKRSPKPPGCTPTPARPGWRTSSSVPHRGTRRTCRTSISPARLRGSGDRSRKAITWCMLGIPAMAVLWTSSHPSGCSIPETATCLRFRMSRMSPPSNDQPSDGQTGIIRCPGDGKAAGMAAFGLSESVANEIAGYWHKLGPGEGPCAWKYDAVSDGVFIDANVQNGWTVDWPGMGNGPTGPGGHVRAAVLTARFQP